MVGRIHERLVAAYGEKNVFLDVVSMPLGSDFREMIKSSITLCEVVLVVIGADWSPERLNQPGDFVLAEIESALQLDRLVIPILDGATPMPGELDLPPEIGQLAFRQLARLRPGPDFQHDIERLLDDLTRRVEARRQTTPDDEDRMLEQLETLVSDENDRTEDVTDLAGRISLRLKEAPIKDATKWYRFGLALSQLGQPSLATEALEVATTGHSAGNAPIRALEVRAACSAESAVALADTDTTSPDIAQLISTAQSLIDILLAIEHTPERLALRGKILLLSASVEENGTAQQELLAAAAASYGGAVSRTPSASSLAIAIQVLALTNRQHARRELADFDSGERDGLPSVGMQLPEDFWSRVDRGDLNLARQLAATPTDEVQWEKVVEDYLQAFRVRSSRVQQRVVLEHLETLARFRPEIRRLLAPLWR